MLDNALVIYGSPMGAPLANVMLSLLHRVGHDDLQGSGDSEGTFSWE